MKVKVGSDQEMVVYIHVYLSLMELLEYLSNSFSYSTIIVDNMYLELTFSLLFFTYICV